MVQATTKYFFLSQRIIKWATPNEPYVKLNMDGSSIGNTGMADVRGLLQDSSGLWISGFSLNMGIATKNMA